MLNDKNLFRRRNDGQLVFNNTTNLQKNRFKADSIWTRTSTQIVFIALCAFTDWACFNQLLAEAAYDSGFLRSASLIGLLIAFELSPVYIGFSLKKKRQGYNVDGFICVILFLVFVAAATINIVLRIITKDSAFPLMAAEDMSFSWNNTPQAALLNPQAIYFALLLGIIPIMTSFVSSIASYIMADPLKQEIANLTKLEQMLTDEISQVKAALAEYSADDRYLSRALSEDQACYAAAVKMVSHKRDAYCHYVRERFKEQPGCTASDPAGISVNTPLNPMCSTANGSIEREPVPSYPAALNDTPEAPYINLYRQNADHRSYPMPNPATTEPQSLLAESPLEIIDDAV